MIAEFLLTSLLITSIEYHTSFDISDTTNFDMDTRTVLSKNHYDNPLIAKLNSSDPNIRLMAITQVGESKINSAFMYLAEALKDQDYRIRATSAMSLGKLENTTAIPYLIQSLKDSHHSVRGAAALSLGRLKATESVDELITALNDDNFSVRLSASYSLGVIGSPKAIKPIIKLLNDDLPEIRENAVWVLGLLKATEALPYLKILTQDPNPTVRDSAKKSIFHIKYSILSDTKNVNYTGGEGSNFNQAIKITGVENSFACLRSQKEYIAKLYGSDLTWEQVDKTHIKHNNRHYDLITVKELSSGQYRKFYFDITDFFSKF